MEEDKPVTKEKMQKILEKWLNEHESEIDEIKLFINMAIIKIQTGVADESNQGDEEEEENILRFT